MIPEPSTTPRIAISISSERVTPYEFKAFKAFKATLMRRGMTAGSAQPRWARSTPIDLREEIDAIDLTPDLCDPRVRVQDPDIR